jgi:hypothetical protein
MPITAKAEFLLQYGNRDPAAQIAQTDPISAAKPSDAKQPLPRSPAHTVDGKKISLHRATAHGFGDQIPLNFAVRQIVPPGFTVKFGNAVDQDARVDWHGEQSWSAALKQAVKPLQLKVKLEEKIVHISKL